MTEANFASLGPRLLARKGGAKPAMRPQIAPPPEELAQARVANADALEDLGWNDMGAVEQDDSIAEVVPITSEETTAYPATKGPAKKATTRKTTARTTKKAKTTKTKSSKRTAFTLRLDSDRHLKLRLASTMHGKSAQALVTQALDQMLNGIDNLDALAKRIKRN